MEGFTGLCIGFFFGIVFMEVIDKLKKRIVLRSEKKNNSN